MRRKDREIDREASLAIIDKAEYAVISMTIRDSSPYCIPVNIVRNDDYIYFHCAHEGFKIDCLRYNPRVCLLAVGRNHILDADFTTAYESAIVYGLAEEIINNQEKIEALRLLCIHLAPYNMGKFPEMINRYLTHVSVWRISIDHITGKQNKYDNYKENS